MQFLEFRNDLYYKKIMRRFYVFSKVNSIGLRGLEGYPVSVEVDVGDGLPGVSMVGVLSSEVREAQDRVRTFSSPKSNYQFIACRYQKRGNRL